MPRHDFSTKEPKRDVGGESFTPGFAYLGWVDAQDPKKRKLGKRKDVGGVEGDPRNPQNLSGGAAAELDFGDE